MTQACNSSHSEVMQEDYKIWSSLSNLARQSQNTRELGMQLSSPDMDWKKESAFAFQRKLKDVKRGRKTSCWKSPGKKGWNVFYYGC